LSRKAAGADVKKTVKPLKAEVAEFKRQRIREEACHLIYAHGYEGTTLDAVAERLEVTKPTLYAHYRSKDEILFDICQTGISLSLEALAEALSSGGGALDRLRMVVERTARIVLDNQECIVVYQREEKNLDGPAARRIREQRHRYDKDLALLLEEGRNSGEFEIDDASLAANTIGGMISWVSLWYSPEGKRSASEIIAHVIHCVEKIVAPVKRKG
jgi:AcrR family transcriptional regulator